MIIVYHKEFKKNYKKSSPKIKQKVEERIRLFETEEFNPVLNNHALNGKWLGYRSINMTGDLRAIFKRDAHRVLFVAIDNHSNLYR